MAPAIPFWRRPRFLALLRFVHDRNPFYLLSALCMFIGFRIILGALNSAPGDWKTLLGLIVTLNVYEIAMIALALFLITRRGLQRDGWILLGIEALFLVDLTNLNAELFTASPWLGAEVNMLLFIAAMAKILIVIHVLELRVSTGTVAYIAAQMAFLLGLPGIFRLMRSSSATVSPLQIYAIWWMTGLLILAGAMLVRRVRSRHPTSMASLPWRLYILLPLISLLVHLCGENRVYWVHFQIANIAPVLLATVLAMNQSRLRWHPMVLPASFTLVLLSIGASITPSGHSADLSTVVFGTAISPLRITMVGSAGTLMFLIALHYSLLAVVVCGGCLMLAALGAEPATISHRLDRLLGVFGDISRRLIPDTAAEWGITAIAGAFVLLGIGAAVSLKPPVELDASDPEAVGPVTND